jgi:hypothetical protein
MLKVVSEDAFQKCFQMSQKRKSSYTDANGYYFEEITAIGKLSSELLTKSFLKYFSHIL